MDVSPGVDEINMLATIGTSVPIERGSPDRRYGIGDISQIIIHPPSSRADVEFVEMPVGGQENHVLAVVATPVGIERRARRRRRCLR